jgi:hypothetical protein
VIDALLTREASPAAAALTVIPTEVEESPAAAAHVCNEPIGRNTLNEIANRSRWFTAVCSEVDRSATTVIPTDVEESPAAAAQPADPELGKRRKPSCKPLYVSM